jgi:uncharacterized small protein (DUF1192 family)
MPENDVITVADLDAQIAALREQEQSMKRQARGLKKKLTGKRAASA